MLTAKDIKKTGQSLWLDNIRRDFLLDGTLSRMMRDRAVTGLTSNPSIFEKALSSPLYAEPMAKLSAGKSSPEKIFETLAVEDIRLAADLLKPVHEASGGLDGFVSMEVSPKLARDAARTAAEGLRLYELVGKPNLMIKVPATKEGLLAGENLLKKGVSVNFTLIFSVERYREVAQAYISAMNWRARNSLPSDGLASVASFFVSRIDTAADKALAALPGGAALKGRAGVANSLLAYKIYRDFFYSPGAVTPPQRILWASTSVKDPAYRPSLYMEELALPGSVNTAPEEALEAYFSDGRIDRAELSGRCEAAAAHFKALAELGVDFGKILADLETDGIEKFSRSYDGILTLIAGQRAPSAAKGAPARPGVPGIEDDTAEAYLSGALKASGTGAEPLDRVLSLSRSSGVLLVSYLPEEAGLREAVEGLRTALSGTGARKCPLLSGSSGLRASGELRKRGKGMPLVVLLTAEAKKDIVVTGEKYTFWHLQTTQAPGDFEALDLKDRRVLRLHLKHPLDRSLASLSERISGAGRSRQKPGEPKQAEESEMLKLAVKKNNKTNTTSTTKPVVNANEYVTVDYPKNLETITSRHYSVRIGVSDCTSVDISINDRPWQPCRHAVGYWWFDWNNFQPGTHQLVARMHKRNGEYLISKRRRCKAI